jgi:hypothetical protein
MHQHVHPEVGALAHADDGAQEGHPDKGEARDFLGQVDAGVEEQPQHDIAEDHHEHDGQADHHDHFQCACQRIGECRQSIAHDSPW